MKHSPGFLSMVQEAATRVKELTLEQARERLQASPETLLVDVREDREWSAGHATGALHLGKGVLERDIEQAIPDTRRPVIMYCGGGYRSILTADVAQQMGYREVYSLAGGFRAMMEAGWPMEIQAKDS